MLNEIRKALDALGEHNVFFGAVPHQDAGFIWDYCVFARRNTRRAGASRMDFTEQYDVTVVREDYIPEGYEYQVASAVAAIPGLRLADSDIIWAYDIKPGTNTAVEICTISFVRARKGAI